MKPLWKFGSLVPVIGLERAICPKCGGIAVQRACRGHRHAGRLFRHGKQSAIGNRRRERLEGGQGSCAHDRFAWIEAERPLWRGTLQASNRRAGGQCPLKKNIHRKGRQGREEIPGENRPRREST